MNAGYVYVLGFDDGAVKIGRTQNSERRLKTHRSNARRWGRTITGSWVSPLHLEWSLNEDTLKIIAAKHGGTPVSPEFFTGAEYAAVAGAAATLPFTAPDEGVTDGAACLRHRRSARECAISRGALDAKTRERADPAWSEWWEHFKAITACARCRPTT